MASKRHPDIGYVTGLISDNDVIAVVAVSESLENENLAHSFLTIQKDKRWSLFEEDLNIVSVTVGRGTLARHLASLGMYGEVIINEPGAVLHEHVHKGKNGPSDMRTMNEVRAVGDTFMAVGMRRQVFKRRIVGGPWSRDDSGVLLAEDDPAIAGFLSLDGLSTSEVYAVGYRGEIWMRDAKRWHQIESPTNARLECVRCAPDGGVLACGEQGVVLQGRGQQWAAIDTSLVESTLTSAAYFGDRWYLSDEEGGLFIAEGGRLQPDLSFAKLEATTGRLAANERTLLSIGEADLTTFDGKRWQRVSHPPIDPT